MSRTVRITYFVHGTTTDNEQGLASGWKDCGLSELGRKQSRELRDQTRDKKFDVVFCSDLKRAVESTEITWKNIYPIVRDNRLRECNYGDLNGADAEKVDSLAYKSIDKPFPNGESYMVVEERIREFLEDLLNMYAGKHVAIVAHKAPQLALDVILNGKSWEQAMKEDWRLKAPKEWKPGWDYALQTKD